jgi:hypothetical protein
VESATARETSAAVHVSTASALTHAPEGTAATAAGAYAPVSNAVTTTGWLDVSLRCSGALSRTALAWTEGVATGWSETTLPGPKPVTRTLAEITLIQTLLSLCYGRACS